MPQGALVYIGSVHICATVIAEQHGQAIDIPPLKRDYSSNLGLCGCE